MPKWQKRTGTKWSNEGENVAEQTETKVKSKKVGNIFSDYKTNSNIADAEINKMKLYKKINTLEIDINSNEYIEIK